MRNGSLFAFAVMALGMTGCIFTGGSPSNSPLAKSPEGVAGVVTTASDTYKGELLTVTNADLTMRTSEGILVIPYSRLQRGDFDGIDVHIAGAPSPTNLDHLRYASRYPYGIPGAAMKAILAMTGRSTPDTARAR